MDILEQIISGGIITIIAYLVISLFIVWLFISSAVKNGVYEALIKYDKEKNNQSNNNE
ncbi:MAG: hypothetical protein IJ326_05405 [Lachnospiraceae bacterium]|nr:hypothetical protein [Lachnospiraceae bacterium]